VMVISIAFCYLFMVKYDAYYECDFVLNTKKNTISPNISNYQADQLEKSSLMLVEKDSVKGRDNILIVTTKVSDGYLDYFVNSSDKKLLLQFEGRSGNQYTNGVIGKIIQVKNGDMILQIISTSADEPLFKGKVFVNYPMKGKIQIKNIPFIKNIFS